MIYKLVSKAITNRLKPIMHSIISSNQSFFIPVRLITDNIMLAHKLLHTLKGQKRGKVENMAVKLDMSKAYDRVELPYLQEALEALRFDPNWIRLVLSYVTTVSYLVLVNGKPGLQFTQSRGLRQGDPLSPYLFFICVERLSSLINKAESKGEVKGLAVKRGGTNTSHLFFIDVNILFCRATKEEWWRVKGVLNLYEKGSGQMVNNQNSLFFFSSNTPLEDCNVMT